MTSDGAPTVLVVDDEPSIRTVLVRYLSATGYEPLEAATGAAALAQLKAHRVAAMLCDVNMPGMSGIALLPQAIAHDPDLAIIMLTAVGDPPTAIQCLKQGAADYLIKPVDLEELGLALTYALRTRQLEIDRRGLEQWLAQEVAKKTHELELQQRRIEHLSVSVLSALVAALEPVGSAGRTHSVRVAHLAAQLATRLGLDGDAADVIQTAGRLHDVGRLALRDEGLARATATELVGSRHDTEIAARLLEPLRHHQAVRDIIAAQHERWDGRGPAGLHGDAIPLGARILAVANLYDELVAPPEGGAGLKPQDALANLHGLGGTLLDARVLDALGEVVAEA